MRKTFLILTIAGTDVMQVWFPKSQFSTQDVVLHCENGQITVPAPNAFSRSGGQLTLAVTNNVVCWIEEGALYEANTKYVGLIEGDRMWGRVYGWNPGDQSVGIWQISPKLSSQQPAK